MNRVLVSIPSICLAYFAAACGADDGPATAGTGGAAGTPGLAVAAGTGGAAATSAGAGTGAAVGAGNAGAAADGTCLTPPCLGVGAGAAGAAAAGVGNTGVGAGATGAGATGAGATGAGATGAGATGAGVGAAGAAGGGVAGAGGATADPAGGGATADPAGGGATADPAGGGATADPVGGAAGQAAVDPDPQPSGPEPTLTTSGENSAWANGEVVEVEGGADITVDENDVQQRWDGFGGTFNERGWDALLELSEADRARAITLLFDKEDGAGFTYGRIPIGSSDYGLDRYSLAPTANDFEMNDFSIDRDRNLLIPYIKAALAVKPDILFWGSPWAPPGWMTTQGAADDGAAVPSNIDMDSRIMKDDADTLGAHALYLARFVEEYATEGINVIAVHPQNEPGWAQHYPSCDWPGNLMRDYIGGYLGPLFAERLPNVEVWLGTMSNTTSDSIVTGVMGDATASSYVKGIALQWAMVSNSGGYVRNYDVPIMQSEHQCGNNPWENTYVAAAAPNDYAYAEEGWGRIKDWLGNGVNSYLAWNMVLDTVGHSVDTVRPWAQNALLSVDRNSKSLNITQTYSMFRHLAQYVEPGANRIGVSGDALAFKNPDGSIVTVIHNGGSSDDETTLAVGGTTVQFTIPARGWATVNWQ